MSSSSAKRQDKAKPTAADAIYAAIGLRIRDRREWLSMTQGVLAERSELTRTSIVNLEAGRQRIPIHVLCRIANALGGTAEQFLKNVVLSAARVERKRKGRR